MKRSVMIGALIIVFIIVVISTFSYMSGLMSKPPTTDQGPDNRESTAMVKITLRDGSTSTFVTEIADTPEKQAKGLMNRASMPVDSGMLFVFEDDVVHYFWMKDTLIPLDMIFIGQDGKVLNIHQNATPLSLDIVQSSGPCKYVLEINGGICAARGICAGDVVVIE